LYNVYNALAATSLCLALGIETEQIITGLEAGDSRLRPGGDDHGR